MQSCGSGEDGGLAWCACACVFEGLGASLIGLLLLGVILCV